MKKFIALLLVICMVFALTACSKGANNGGTPATEAPAAEPVVITACIASEPETIDPTMISSVDGNTYVNHLFEGLLRYGSTGKAAADDPKMNSAELELGQAKSYTVSDDGLVYTFTLRDDIFWSDGQPVKAQPPQAGARPQEREVGGGERGGGGPAPREGRFLQFLFPLRVPARGECLDIPPHGRRFL